MHLFRLACSEHLVYDGSTHISLQDLGKWEFEIGVDRARIYRVGVYRVRINRVRINRVRVCRVRVF